jgi:nitronate monooxygenase
MERMPERNAAVPNLSARERASAFCRRYGLRLPILQAPMAGACPSGLALPWPMPAGWAGSAH